eukprot:gene14430-biopygen7456
MSGSGIGSVRETPARSPGTSFAGFKNQTVGDLRGGRPRRQTTRGNADSVRTDPPHARASTHAGRRAQRARPPRDRNPAVRMTSALPRAAAAASACRASRPSRAPADPAGRQPTQQGASRPSRAPADPAGRQPTQQGASRPSRAP